MKIVALLSLAILLAGCVTQRGFPPEHQIVNFDHVDNHIYRGAQPNHHGFDYLASIGVKNVVNLRRYYGTPRDIEEEGVLPDEAEYVQSLGMRYLAFPLSGAAAPDESAIDELLKRMAVMEGPIFVHCQYGCDRTGLVVACWQMRHNGWSADKAVADAEAHGMSVWLPNFKHFIKHFK